MSSNISNFSLFKSNQCLRSKPKCTVSIKLNWCTHSNYITHCKAYILLWFCLNLKAACNTKVAVWQLTPTCLLSQLLSRSQTDFSKQMYEGGSPPQLPAPSGFLSVYNKNKLIAFQILIKQSAMASTFCSPTSIVVFIFAKIAHFASTLAE